VIVVVFASNILCFILCGNKEVNKYVNKIMLAD